MIRLSGQSRHQNIMQRFRTAKTSQLPKNHSWKQMLMLPKESESFLSWLLRQAWAFDTTPRRFIQTEKEYWMTHENISLVLPRKWKWLGILDILSISSTFEAILRQRGLTTDLRRLRVDISKWHDFSKNPKPNKYQLRNYYHYQLRYCPLCWKDSHTRYFCTVWRLPFVLVCLEHGTELRESCPSCGTTIYDEKMVQDLSTRMAPYLSPLQPVTFECSLRKQS